MIKRRRGIQTDERESIDRTGNDVAGIAAKDSENQKNDEARNAKNQSYSVSDCIGSFFQIETGSRHDKFTTKNIVSRCGAARKMFWRVRGSGDYGSDHIRKTLGCAMIRRNEVRKFLRRPKLKSGSAC